MLRRGDVHRLREPFVLLHLGRLAHRVEQLAQLLRGGQLRDEEHRGEPRVQRRGSSSTPAERIAASDGGVGGQHLHRGLAHRGRWMAAARPPPSPSRPTVGCPLSRPSPCSVHSACSAPGFSPSSSTERSRASAMSCGSTSGLPRSTSRRCAVSRQNRLSLRSAAHQLVGPVLAAAPSASPPARPCTRRDRCAPC